MKWFVKFVSVDLEYPGADIRKDKDKQKGNSGRGGGNTHFLILQYLYAKMRLSFV